VAEATFEKRNMTDDPSWTLGNVDFLEKALGTRNTYRHLDKSQILTITKSKLNFK